MSGRVERVKQSKSDIVLTELAITGVFEMLSHPRSTASLSDAGAHAPSVCDTSFTTDMPTHRVKGRTRGLQLGLEEVIRKQTSEPANLCLPRSRRDRGGERSRHQYHRSGQS